MIRELENGKCEVTWPIATVTVNGHTVTGRPETVAAITGATPTKLSEVRMIGSRADCEKQL